MSSDQVVLAAGSGRGPDLNVLLIDDQPIVGEQVRRMHGAAFQKVAEGISWSERG